MPIFPSTPDRSAPPNAQAQCAHRIPGWSSAHDARRAARNGREFLHVTNGERNWKRTLEARWAGYYNLTSSLSGNPRSCPPCPTISYLPYAQYAHNLATRQYRLAAIRKVRFSGSRAKGDAKTLPDVPVSREKLARKIFLGLFSAAPRLSTRSNNCPVDTCVSCGQNAIRSDSQDLEAGPWTLAAPGRDARGEWQPVKSISVPQAPGHRTVARGVWSTNPHRGHGRNAALGAFARNPTCRPCRLSA